MVNRSCSWRVRPCGGSERGGRSWRASCTAIRQTFTEDRSPDGHSVPARRGAGSVLTSKPFSLNSRRARHKNQAFHRQCDEAPALPAFQRRGGAKVSGEGRVALADSIAATLGGLREAAGYICEHLGYTLGSSAGREAASDLCPHGGGEIQEDQGGFANSDDSDGLSLQDPPSAPN